MKKIDKDLLDVCSVSGPLDDDEDIYTPELIQSYIRDGANVNVKNQHGKTPLMMASINGHLEFVKILVQNRANLDISDKEGETALLSAIFSNNLEIIKFLVKKGANVNAKHKFNGTTLMSIYTFVPKKEHFELTKLLIENGIDVNIKGLHDYTALMNATHESTLEVMKLLIKAGANLDAQDKLTKRTALMFAASVGDLEKVKLLVGSGAKIGLKSKHGYTALDYAKTYTNSNPKVVKYLENL